MQKPVLYANTVRDVLWNYKGNYTQQEKNNIDGW